MIFSWMFVNFWGARYCPVSCSVMISPAHAQVLLDPLVDEEAVKRSVELSQRLSADAISEWVFNF